VVISIIALLMTIMMPGLSAAKDHVKNVMCQANLRQWSLVWKMFTDGNNGRFMSGGEVGGPDYTGPEIGGGYGGEGRASEGDHSWPLILWRHYGERKLLCCPRANKPPAMAAGDDRGEREFMRRGMLSTWGLWVNHPEDFIYGSYGVNSYIYDRGGTKDGFPYWRHIAQKRAERIPIMMDCFWCEGFPRHTNPPPEYPTIWIGDPSTYIQRFCVDRHRHTTNVLGFDLSVQNTGLKGLWRLKWSPAFDTNGPWTSSYAPPPIWPDWMKPFKDY